MIAVDPNPLCDKSRMNIFEWSRRMPSSRCRLQEPLHNPMRDKSAQGTKSHITAMKVSEAMQLAMTGPLQTVEQMSRSYMILSPLRKNCCRDSLSANDYPPTRCLMPTMIFCLDSDSMPTMIADMREFCSRSEACGLRGRSMRDLNKSWHEWELRSSLRTKTRKNITKLRTPKPISRMRLWKQRLPRTKMLDPNLPLGAIPRAHSGTKELRLLQRLHKGETPSHRLPKLRTSLVDHNFYRRSSLYNHPPLTHPLTTSSRRIHRTALEPG